MASYNCRKCGRALRNPVSVRLEKGPVCRAKDKQTDNLQREFDFMEAQFEVLKHEAGIYIYILDTGHNIGRTVTNDAENVIVKLYLEEGITDETRIFYEDSQGEVDEILHKGKSFKGFKAGHEWVLLCR